MSRQICYEGDNSHCTRHPSPFTPHTAHSTHRALHTTHFTLRTSHFTLHTKGKLLWREAWALRVLGLMNDEDSSKSKHIRRTFELIQAWVAAQAAADSASAAVYSHVDIDTHSTRKARPHTKNTQLIPTFRPTSPRWCCHRATHGRPRRTMQVPRL